MKILARYLEKYRLLLNISISSHPSEKGKACNALSIYTFTFVSNKNGNDSMKCIDNPNIKTPSFYSTFFLAVYEKKGVSMTIDYKKLVEEDLKLLKQLDPTKKAKYLVVMPLCREEVGEKLGCLICLYKKNANLEDHYLVYQLSHIIAGEIILSNSVRREKLSKESTKFISEIYNMIKDRKFFDCLESVIN